MSLVLSVFVSMSSMAMVFAEGTDVSGADSSTAGGQEADTPSTDTPEAEPETPVVPDKQVLRFTWINIGAGDAILVKMPNDEFVLVDGGLEKKGKKVLSEVKKQMKAAGASQIKYLIATHSDEDHVGGLTTVIKSDIVSKEYTTLYYSGKCSHKKGKAKAMMNAAKKKGIRRVAPKYKDTFSEGGTKVTFAQPNQKFKTANENSLAMWFEYKNKKVLLTGDCSHHVQSMLLKKKADVLDMPHHGAIGGTSVKFFRRYGSPKYVVSSADGKTHGHPCPYAFQCLYKANKKALAYRTDKLGNITCTITYTKSTNKTTLTMSPKGKNPKVYITKKAPRAYWIAYARKLAKKGK